jgi:hypothetical protein
MPKPWPYKEAFPLSIILNALRNRIIHAQRRRRDPHQVNIVNALIAEHTVFKARKAITLNDIDLFVNACCGTSAEILCIDGCELTVWRPHLQVNLRFFGFGLASAQGRCEQCNREE